MIRNPEAFLRSIWNWRPLLGCFPRRIEPTDIDGFVEVGGYFLILEGKGRDVPIPEGQLRFFQRAMRWNETVPGLFTVVVIWGDAATERIDRLQFWPAAPFDAGWDALRSYCSAWAECAEERAAIQEESSDFVMILDRPAKATA